MFFSPKRPTEREKVVNLWEVTRKIEENLSNVHEQLKNRILDNDEQDVKTFNIILAFDKLLPLVCPFPLVDETPDFWGGGTGLSSARGDTTLHRLEVIVPSVATR